eukprot:846616_1
MDEEEQQNGYEYLYPQIYYEQNSAGNGSCLFNSVVGFIAFENTGNIIPVRSDLEFELQNELRQKTVDYIREHLNESIGCDGDIVETFDQFFTRTKPCSVIEHLDNMKNVSKSNTAEDLHIHGGQGEIVAITRVLERSVFVYQNTGSIYKLWGGMSYPDAEHEPITLCYDDDTKHYTYLINLNSGVNTMDFEPDDQD